MATRLVSMPGRLAAPRGRVAAAVKVAAPFYLSKEWRALVASVIAARGRVCQACGASGGRIIGDHLAELKDGGAALDPANVRLLCAKCHGVKTAKSKRARVGLW